MKKIGTPICSVCALLFVYGLKTYFSRANAAELSWMLKPTAALVSVVTGISFHMEPELGVVNSGHTLIIAPGCAGGNFMVIALLLVTWTGISRTQTIRQKTAWLLLSPVLAYGATIAVNSIRVILSIYLYRAPIYSAHVTEEGIHRLAGVIIYVSGLYLLHSLIHCLPFTSGRHRLPVAQFQARSDSCQPILCYLLIVIVVPLLNHPASLLSSLFLEHCASVALGCLIVLLFFHLSGARFFITGSGKQKQGNCNMHTIRVKNGEVALKESYKTRANH